MTGGQVLRPGEPASDSGFIFADGKTGKIPAVDYACPCGVFGVTAQWIQATESE